MTHSLLNWLNIQQPTRSQNILPLVSRWWRPYSDYIVIKSKSRNIGNEHIILVFNYPSLPRKPLTFIGKQGLISGANSLRNRRQWPPSPFNSMISGQWYAPRSLFILSSKSKWISLGRHSLSPGGISPTHPRMYWYMHQQCQYNTSAYYLLMP